MLNRFTFYFLILFGISGCLTHRGTTTTTAPTPTPGSWISSFSTISSSVTNSTPTLAGIYSGSDSSGNLYLSGSTSDGWVVVKSSDEGLTWALDSLVTGSTTYGYRIVGDSLGNVFNVGQSGSYGVIRKRDAATQTWSTVYTGQGNPGYATYFFGVAVDSSDQIFVVGSAFLHMPSVDVWPDTGLREWVVLKSSDHGATWSTVDAYYPSDHTQAQPAGLLVAASGALYVYGSTGTAHTSLVRKSADGGTTWTTVFEDINCVIQGMVEWNNGLVISEEYYENGASVPQMRVRGTTDNFAHLMTLDTYNPTGATQVSTGAVKVDSRNYLYYSGYWTDASNSHLTLRVNRGDGNWTLIDDFTTDVSSAGDVFFDSTKGIFNIGTNSTSWVLRNATINIATAFSPASMANGSDFVSPIPAGAKRIFTTWRRHDGNFGADATSAMAAADAFCNSDPRKPLYNPTATYKAMLVSSVRRACISSFCATSGVAEQQDWVFAPSTSYVSYEGQSLFTTNANGIFTTVNRTPITVSVDYAWTGLHASGDWTNDDSNNVCQGWTTNNGDGSDWSTGWDLHGPTYDDIYVNYYQYCDASSPLICVEQ
jgi:hypothetical protein